MLWLVPLAVIGFADRVAAVVGTAAAQALDMTPDGSTSGITSVLVFGAGTNYALLLISRYREELGRKDNHREALKVAVRQAGPAILASNATVVLALLTLVLASSPSTRSLGVQAASGLVVAAVFVLLVLPPLLALFGRRLFWPFVPRVGAKALTDSGIWHRIADAVARRPARVTTVAIAGLLLLCLGLASTPVGLTHDLKTTARLRRDGLVALPEDLGVQRGEATRSLLAAKSVADLVTWSGGLYNPPAKFRSW